jgi:hypothetical protein
LLFHGDSVFVKEPQPYLLVVIEIASVYCAARSESSNETDCGVFYNELALVSNNVSQGNAHSDLFYAALTSFPVVKKNPI